MGKQVFANNARSSLASGIGASDASLILKAGEGALFPALAAGDWFMSTLVDVSGNLEIIKVTGRATDVLTIERGQEGTTPRAFSAGDIIGLRLTKGGLDWLRDSNPAYAPATHNHDSSYYTQAQVDSLLGAKANEASLQTVWIPASAMAPRMTNGPAPGYIEGAVNYVVMPVLDFDPATAEYTQFHIRMPKSWNNGNVTARFLWLSTNTGDVSWKIQAVAIGDDDNADPAFGVAQEVVDSVTLAGDIMQSAESAAITIGGSPAALDLVVFQVYRDAAAAGDTCLADARLVGVVITYGTASMSDA